MSEKNSKEPNTVLFTWSFGVVVTLIGAAMLAGGWRRADRTRPCPCYPGHFDPQTVWFDP